MKSINTSPFDFPTLRDPASDYVYVDKTAQIYEIAKSSNFIALLDALPAVSRRGKTKAQLMHPNAGKYVLLIDECDAPIAELPDTLRRTESGEQCAVRLRGRILDEDAGCSRCPGGADGCASLKINNLNALLPRIAKNQKGEKCQV